MHHGKTLQLCCFYFFMNIAFNPVAFVGSGMLEIDSVFFWEYLSWVFDIAFHFLLYSDLSECELETGVATASL